jgi:hypothetical protein
MEYDGPGVSADLCGAGWTAYSTRGTSAADVWAHASDSSAGRLVGLFVGCDAEGTIHGDWASEAAAVALDDLEHRLWRQPVAVDRGAEGAISLPAVQPYLGALKAVEETLGLTWVLARTAYATALTQPAESIPAIPAAALLSLVATEPASISVELGHVDVLMADLADLHLGDVVRFPARIQDGLPALLECEGHTQVLCAAELGQQLGRVAARLEPSRSLS